MTDTRFIEKFEENVKLYPDNILFQDERASISFREADTLSGRVYAYLKERNIGREDFVMILLPHGIDIYVCTLGVWKAGAAFVVCDVSFPRERIQYIRGECKCKLIIDDNAFAQILQTPEMPGHAETSVGDVAFAIYTSGSEGNPKGALHEYGRLEFMSETLAEVCRMPLPVETILFSFLPVYALGVAMTSAMAAYTPFTLDIGSLRIFKDPVLLQDYLIKRKVTLATLPPSYYKQLKLNSPWLKCVYLLTELVNNVFSECNKVINLYIQSEGYSIASFEIDHLYDYTPIGQPRREGDITIIDDEGKQVPEGCMGELCYINPYFRGYINDEERTRQSFVGEYFRSGDIAYKNEDDNYVVLGRKTDMIKINGNRIEPAEIEAAVKRVLGVDWAFAKGFVQEDRSFICVYYTADITIDYAQVREELMKILPNYMIPSYFVHIDKIPHLPNGKVDRQAFQAPDIEQYRTTYTAPTNELEKKICDAMQQVLELERVGINDDFFLLGGDSLRTIRLATNIGVSGISVADIYQGRTPQRIADTWMEKQMG